MPVTPPAFRPWILLGLPVRGSSASRRETSIGEILMQRAFVVCLLLTAFSYSATAAENRKAEVVGAVSTPFIKALQNLSTERTTASILSLKPIPNVVLEGAEAAFIFPVVGSAGAFRTEAVLFNRLNRSQLVDLYFLPLGGGSCNVGAVRLRLDANTWYFYSDFVFDVF